MLRAGAARLSIHYSPARRRYSPGGDPSLHNGTVSGPWPLVGRDDDVDAVLRAHRDRARHGVLLTGEGGVGTTRVLDEVIEALRSDGRAHNRVVGSEGNRSTPFGALAHVRPPGQDGSELFEAIRSVIGTPRSASARFVTCIDEIALLDEASLGLLSDLLVSGLAFVVATLRDGQAAPPALATLERTCRIERRRIEPLDLHQTLELVDHALVGSVEGSTAMALWAASAGNPLFLREAIDGSRAAGRLVVEDGVWILHGAPAVTPRLQAAFDGTLATLEAADRDVLELLAVATPVTVEAVEAGGLLDAAVRLEGEGLLATRERDGAAVVEVAQPLLAARMRDGLSPLRRRALLPRATSLVAAAPLPDDVLRRVTWQLECGRTPPADELEAAASIAHARDDLDDSEQLARLALESRTSLPALLVRAEALHGLCRFAEADEVLRAGDALVADDLSRLRLTIVRHRLRLWGEHDAAGSEAVLRELAAVVAEPLAHDMALVAIANTMVFTGQPARALDQRAELRTDHELADVGLLFPESMALMLLGRLDEALAVAERAHAVRSAMSPSLPIGHPSLFALGLGMVLVERGELNGADEVLGTAYRTVVQARIPQLHTWLALARGRCALARGHVSDARRWFAEARAVSERSRFAMGRRIAVTGLRVCAAQVGDDEALHQLEAVSTEMPPDRGLLWPERVLGDAWSALSRRDRAGAVALLLAGATEAAARGEVLLQAELLYEAARCGAGGDVAGRLEALGDVPEGPLAAARRAFVRGVARRDAAHLALAEKAFADLGADLAAAESASQLSAVLGDHGRRREARHAAARSAQHRRGSVGVDTPALAGTATSVDLSPREREIAELAAAGMSSKAIAATLHLSVRTVSNHLQNVYGKLGVSGRSELAELLG